MNLENKDNDSFRTDTEYSPKRAIRRALDKLTRILLGSPESAPTVSDEERRQIILRGARISIFFLFGFLFEYARLPFGAYPLASALLGASSNHTGVIALGCLTSIAVNGISPSHLFSLIILITLRIIGRFLIEKPQSSFRDDPIYFIRHELFSESIYLRMSAVSIAVFSLGLWEIIENNFRYYDLWGALLGMVTAPVAAYIFSMFFDAETRNKRSAAFGAFIIASIYSLRSFPGMGPFLSLTASQVTVLASVRRVPPIYSLTLATILGFISDIKYTPMFLFSACAYIAVVTIAKERQGSAFLASLLTSGIWGLAINGREAFYTVFPALLSAAAIDNLIKAIIPAGSDSESYIPAKLRQSILTTKENEEKLEKMSESFKNLSDAFKRLSDRLSRPGIFEIRKECDDILDSFCTDCKNSGICWGEDYNTTIGFLHDASEHLEHSGRIDEGIFPKALKDRCENTGEILREINKKIKELYRDSLEKEKLTVFSADYSALSRIISENIEEKQHENAENRELTAKAIEMLGKYKNDFHTISVWGKRKIRVYARLKTVSENTVGMREFKKIMEECCSCSFGNPNLKLEGKSMSITLNMKPIVKAEAGASRISAGNLPLCGDSPSFFEGHDSYFYALISDGMGTGANAALASGICEIFLREMLEGGNRIDTSVNMLNAVIASKGNECTATVDIMELDLFSGNCTFLKSGAASSFILRGGNVYKLSARTMPLGILDEADTDMQRVRLMPGDIIFLVSDGAAPKENYENLISIIKCSSNLDTPKELADRVIEHTRKISKDDISCVAIKIGEV